MIKDPQITKGMHECYFNFIELLRDVKKGYSPSYLTAFELESMLPYGGPSVIPHDISYFTNDSKEALSLIFDQHVVNFFKTRKIDTDHPIYDNRSEGFYLLSIWRSHLAKICYKRGWEWVGRTTWPESDIKHLQILLFEVLDIEINGEETKERKKYRDWAKQFSWAHDAIVCFYLENWRGSDEIAKCQLRKLCAMDHTIGNLTLEAMARHFLRLNEEGPWGDYYKDRYALIYKKEPRIRPALEKVSMAGFLTDKSDVQYLLMASNLITPSEPLLLEVPALA